MSLVDNIIPPALLQNAFLQHGAFAHSPLGGHMSLVETGTDASFLRSSHFVILFTNDVKGVPAIMCEFGLDWFRFV